ncbi:MAG TPA: MFS transporter [Candidatus Ruania gallistercoris]|uniref:MFS transporter n=1 Tax=Candidatus Ruania gallistercoris TaxID=2838746 RepID=A0A9D2EFH7_9MICO|nr:MFS transporter [Candidatus Ruania gallistercoris]
MTTRQDHPPARVSARSWAGLGLLMIPVFMAALDMTVLFLAIPTIAAELLPSGTQQLWVLHIGDIVGASLVLTAGRLVDRFGPRRLLVLGLLAYGVASTLAAFAPSVELLIAARAFLGASAVTMMPSGMALIRRMFPQSRQFSIALALFMAAFSGGMALGPPLGGLLLEHFWWGSIFLVNVPVSVGVVLLASRLLPQIPGTGSGRIDLFSVALSAAGVAGIVFGAQELAAGGWNVLHALAVAAGVALLAAFVRRQRVLTTPVLDLRLFRSGPFSVALVAILLVITVSAGADLQFPQHLQVVIGHTPLETGMLLVIPAAAAVVATAASPLLLRWLRPGPAIGVSVLVAVLGAGGMVLLVSAGADASTGLLVLAAAVVAFGIAPVFSLGANVAISNAPVEQTGSATAMQEVSGSLGNTSGLALGGSIAFLGYAGAMREVLPAGLSETAAAQSLQSVGGALAAARDLSPDLAGQLIEATKAAFTVATRDAYLLIFSGLILVAVLVFVGLRHARIEEESGDE